MLLKCVVTCTAFTLVQLNQPYLDQVKFPLMKRTQCVRLSSWRAPFNSLVYLKLVLLASVNVAIGTFFLE